MPKWRECKLGDIIELIGGGTPKTAVSEYWNGDIPWLSVVDFNTGNKFVYTTEKTITKAGLENSSTKILSPGDIIVSARGTVGAMAVLKKPMAFNQSCYGVRNVEGVSDKDYLYYLLKDSVGNLQQIAHGGVFDTITRETFDSIDVSLPPLPEQRAIAAVLSSLDDKIDLLHRQNKTLEDLSVALFKKWFIDFDFPIDREIPYKASGGKMTQSELGPVPVGWKTGVINDLCETLASGGTPSTSVDAYWGGEINWFATKELQDCYLFQSEKKISKFGLENSSAKMFPKGSVLMAIYAAPTVGRLGILGREASFNQATCGFVARKDVVSGPFIYLLLLSLREELNGLANGAAQQNLNVRLVREFKTVIPDNRVVEKFDSVIKPMFEKILNNSAQAQTLTAFKTLLLPKLMSGELNA